MTKETLQAEREGPGPPWIWFSPVPTASSSQPGAAGPLEVALSHRLGTGLRSGVQGLGAQDGSEASLFTVVLGLGAKELLLDLLNPLATSQSRQVPLPEPFITPIPGCAQQWSSLESRGRGSPLLGAVGLGTRP